MFADKKSETLVKVTAMKHFINIFENSITNFDTGRNNIMKMIFKNLL